MKTKINKVSILTLGCSKNLVDSETLLGQLKANGYLYTENVNEADALIINTCGFIKPAKEESIGVIIEACELRKKKSLKKLIVCGCLSERYAEELKDQVKDVDHFFGIDSHKQILEVLDPDMRKELKGERELLTPKHYAYIKISDGCDHKCSFCAIPLIRGAYRSREIDDIVSEAKLLAGQGVKELNLIAQDTTFYGVDLNKKRLLADLLEGLSGINGPEWIRLMYTYPKGFPEEVLDVMADHSNICKYVDIPLQHISDKVLKSMKRGLTGDDTRKLIEKIRTKVPGIAIRSTFIVGYPNETEKDFKELLKFINEYKLERVGVFTYSQEEDTSADPLGDPIAEELKDERRNALMEAQMNISYKRNQSYIDKTIKVMIDEERGDLYFGRTESDAPEVDNGVFVSSTKKLKPGDFVNVRISSAEEYDLHGEVVD